MHNIHRLLVTALLVASKATDDVFHANLFMAQCGGISVSELNKLEIKLCRRLSWRLMPSPEQLHRLRSALDDGSTGYWEAWRNTPKAAATCDDILPPCSQEPLHEAKRMPHAKSFQDHLGRILFGAGSTFESMAAKPTAHDEVQQQQERAPGSDLKPSPPSPGSPRSVFRRIFSEQVFSFAS
uniref:Cyclin N-terminal domain-containing protein n=1 Tax=Prymnesium polylepis TaxID=72548 RepID=A0A7S4M8A4_9EUKA